LKEGKQTIRIQAVNSDSVYAEASLSVSIELPWYKTQLAWFIYVLGIFTIGLLIYRIQNQLLSKQKQELLSDQEKKLQDITKKHEQVLLKLEKERLKEEVADVRNQLKSKTIELANKAKENEEKNRLLQTIKEKLDEIKTDSDPLKVKWSEIQQLIHSYITMQDTTFEIQMDELHQEFFKKLKASYPGLSGNDLRLCAYIKLGFNSKEISDLLNILPSSVYISRSRLRKKLNLEGEEDLFNHLNSI
jgi:DNA-binding CsgD family transcriptional regulator